MVTLTNSPRLLIDLGQTNTLHRVYLTGPSHLLQSWPNWSQNKDNPPIALIVAYVGNTATTANQVAEFTVPYDAGNPVDTEVDLRFSPVAGRYVRIELQTQVTWGFNHWPGYALASQPPAATNLAWNVGEVELYGFGGPVTNENAVVLPAGAAAPLALAASELSYYLGELTGKPHPIIAPTATNQYPGTVFRIVDLKPLAPNYSTMINNIANGSLPANVNIVTSGREVQFKSWPYRGVLWSVWEFLERQGVRWIYPSGKGDYVPETGVSLAMLPLTMQSSANSIYANWDAASLQPWPPWMLQSTRQAYLYVWRNRWTHSWNASPLGGAEVPSRPTSGSLDANYSEGFAGYPHTLDNVLPSRVLVTNASWWGSLDGVHLINVGVQFDMASSGAASWIAGKVIAYDAYSPIGIYNLLPQDAVQFSIDTNTMAANTLYGGTPTSIPWITGSTHSGGAYYKLLSSVANIATNQIIGGLAYSDIFDPPKSNYPANVRMEVCLYGSPNLPFTAAANSGMLSALTNWHNVCSSLTIYDYSLLFVDYWQPDPRVPVPMVTAQVDRAKYLARIGALNGGCQALVGSPLAPYSIQYNPWDFYAYPRIRWNTNQTAGTLLTEFFNGYYKEAAAPMLAYYQAMENYQLANNADLHFHGYCYFPNPGTFPRSVLNAMQTNLRAAQSLATNWYVISRVNDATNCLNWLTLNVGITNLSTLTNFSGFAAVPTNTYTVNLTNFYATPMPSGYYNPGDAVWNQGGDGYWHFDGTTMIQQTLNFTKAGQYRVDVTSFCNFNNGGLPSQRVFLGSVCFGPTTINTSAVTNSFVVNVSSPTALELVISQDVSGRFLTVSKVQLTKQ